MWSVDTVLIRELIYLIIFYEPEDTPAHSAVILCTYRITFGCRAGSSNMLDNVCWNPSQLLVLNNSIAVKDLHTLMFEGEYGIGTVLHSTIDTIQGAAENQISANAVTVASSKLGNAAQTWLNNVWNDQECQTATNSALSSNAELTDLLIYQFHEESANRVDWITHWRCTGATFGCAGNTIATCPMAATCFDYLVGLFSSMIDAPGGMTALGTNPGSSQGRRTPMYGPSFLSSKLESSIDQLTAYQEQVKMAQAYYNVLEQIQDSASDVISFTASGFDAQLQVEATQQVTSLESSKSIADLYYGQLQFNYNVTNELAMQVQSGPPSRDGDSFDELIDKCRRQMIISAILKVTVATAKLAAGFAGAFVEQGVKAAKEAIEEAEKLAEKQAETGGESSLKGALDLATTATEFYSTSKEMLDLLSGVQSAYNWDPDLQLPTLPTTPDGTDPIDQDYIDASSVWYLAAQKNLSATLVQLSPAFWSNFYLEADNNFSPFLNNPPECGAAEDLTSSIREYLNNVQNFTNYVSSDWAPSIVILLQICSHYLSSLYQGDAMTTAAMSLAPVLGNIATAIATLGAIDQASQSINATLLHQC